LCIERHLRGYRTIRKDKTTGKTPIKLDEHALAVAQRIFGASTKQETVNRALQEIRDGAKRREARLVAERLTAEALDLDALVSKKWSPPDINEN
jgi:Arc/MetJ family transcription regulator